MRATEELANKIKLYEQITDINLNNAEKYFNRYCLGEAIQTEISAAREYELVLLGEGCTSVCYCAKDGSSGSAKKIIKEFFPLSVNDDGIDPRFYFTRELGRNKHLVYLRGDRDKKAILEKYKRFLSTYEVCEELEKNYYSHDATMSVKYELYDSSLNLCYVCNLSGGNTLKEYFNYFNRDLSERISTFDGFEVQLKQCLKILNRAAMDLLFTQNAGYINADIKPDNLWALKIDPDKGVQAVRNIDFGSFVKVDDILKALSMPTADIVNNFFESTIRYYPISDIKIAIDNSKSRNDGCYIKKLDVMALMRCFLEWLGFELDSKDKCYRDTLRQAKNYFYELFAGFDFNLHAYNVYYRLLMLVSSVFSPEIVSVDDIINKSNGLLNLLGANGATNNDVINDNNLMSFNNDVKELSDIKTFGDFFNKYKNKSLLHPVDFIREVIYA